MRFGLNFAMKILCIVTWGQSRIEDDEGFLIDIGGVESLYDTRRNGLDMVQQDKRGAKWILL